MCQMLKTIKKIKYDMLLIRRGRYAGASKEHKKILKV